MCFGERYSQWCMEKLYGGSIMKPRTAQRQLHRPNPDVETACDYYRVTHFIPYVDHLVSGLERKFEGTAHQNSRRVIEFFVFEYSSYEIHCTVFYKYVTSQS